MTGPNSDLTAIFTELEELPQKPLKFISGLVSWAKGEQDPDWGKDKRKGSQRNSKRR